MGYIDDLPGITVKGAQALADEKDRGLAANLLERVIANAYYKLSGDVRDALAHNQFSLQPSLGNMVVGQYRQNEWLDLSEPWRGVWLEPLHGDKRKNAVTQVNQVTVYTESPATLAFKLVGVEQTLDYTITTVANPAFGGAVGVLYPRTQQRGPVKVLVQADVVRLGNTTLRGCGDWCDSCYSGYGYNGWGWGLDWFGFGWFGGCATDRKAFWTTGATADAGLTVSRTSDNAGGVRVDATLACDTYQFICSLLPQLSGAVRHAARVCFADEMRLSNRYNFVTMDRDRVENLATIAAEDYKKSIDRFARDLRTHLNNSADGCLICTGNRITSFRP